MLRIQTILHPTDFSDRSEAAFLLACSLAKEYRAELIVLHVRELVPALHGPGAIAALPEPTESELMEKLRQLKCGNRRVQIDYELAEGKPAVEILRVAKETSADLIVMGTHGRTGLGRLLMGSVAEHVIRKAPCPVLTMKDVFPEALPAEATASRPAEAVAN